MKKKIITALTLVFALSLALTVYALNRPEVSPKGAKADCCAKKDSCPMKNKQAAADEKTSCCDQGDCCKGDSCPMKMNGEKTEGKNCCSKGGDSCPMKKDAEKQTTADAATTTMDMTNVTVAAGSDESCCKPGADCCKDGGSCCKGKHDKK